MKKLVFKTVIRAIVIALVLTVVGNLTSSPVITNEIALAQMDTSNEGFITWELYNAVRPFIDLAVSFLGIWMIYGIFKDIGKFVRESVEEDKRRREM